ncbi:MAG: SU10 major capsid protein [Elusimicrobiota bacterium]
MSEAYTALLQLKGSNDAYERSFGALPHKTEYVNAWKKSDGRDMLLKSYQIGMKALESETGGSGSTDHTLVPLYVDQRVVDTTRKETPLVELIPRVSNNGLTAEYNRVTNKGSAFTAKEDAALSEVDDTYERESVDIKYIYSVGRVTGQANATIPNYMLAGFNPTGNGLGNNPFSDVGVSNANQLEVQMKTRALREKEEDLILNGSKSSDSTEFDGIITLQSGTNRINGNGGSLTWDMIDEAAQTAFDNGGRPNLAVCSSDFLRDVRGLLINTFRYTPAQMGGSQLLPFGVNASVTISTIIGDIPLIPSRFISDKECYFLDTDYIEMRVLQDVTYEKMAKTNDSDKFFLKIYEALIMRAPEFNAYIDNLA